MDCTQRKSQHQGPGGAITVVWSVPCRGLILASMNARGVCELTRGELQAIMDSEGIDILAMQETWEGQYVILNLQGYKWYGRAREDTRGGVGFYVHASLGIQIFRKTSFSRFHMGQSQR